VKRCVKAHFITLELADLSTCWTWVAELNNDQVQSITQLMQLVRSHCNECSTINAVNKIMTKETAEKFFSNCCNCQNMVRNNTEKPLKFTAERAVTHISHSWMYGKNNNYIIRNPSQMIPQNWLGYTQGHFSLLTWSIQVQKTNG
jgi:hypothetical protein